MFIKNGQIMKIGAMIPHGYMKTSPKSSKNILLITKKTSAVEMLKHKTQQKILIQAMNNQ